MKIKATEELELNDSPEINWIAPQKNKTKQKTANSHQENDKAVNLSIPLDIKDGYIYFLIYGNYCF